MPNIRVDDVSYEKLQIYKKKNGVSIQFALKQAIDEFLKKPEKPKS
jgi:hypothetical protein